MSKKPLLSEGTARRWAKYAGIQNESKALLSEMYDKEEDALEEEEGLMEEEEPMEEGEALEEADILAELEEMLAEQDEQDELDEPEDEDEMDDEGEPEEGDEDEDMEDMEDMEDEEEDELDVDAEEAGADEAAMMSQEDVEAALKAGLEAMASAVADALKIKIDVRSGEEIEPEAEAGEGGDEEIMEMDDMPMEEGDYGMKYEGIDRDELVERVMKRVAARLVKESKSK